MALILKQKFIQKPLKIRFGTVIEENKVQVAGMPDIQHEPLQTLMMILSLLLHLRYLPEVKDIDVKKLALLIMKLM